MANLVCSFCAKTQDDVLQLIAAPTARICDECVGLAVSMLRKRLPGWEPVQLGDNKTKEHPVVENDCAKTN